MQLKKSEVLLALSAFGMLCVAYVVLAEDAQQTRVTPEVARVVSVTAARLQPWQDECLLYGSWQARQESTLSSMHAGMRIDRVLVEAGAKVKAGQVLALLEQDRLQSQQTQAEAASQRVRASEQLARAKVDEAQRALSRGKELRPSGAMSEQDYDSLQAAWEIARAQLAAAVSETRLAQAQQRESAIRLAEGVLRAPVAGVVTERLAVEGNLVDSDQTLFRLMHGDAPEFVARVPASQAERFIPGQGVALLDENGQERWQGKIRLAVSRLGEDSGFGKLHITVVEPQVRLPLPGVAGSVRIRLAKGPQLLLDARAIRFDSAGEPFVMVVESGTQVRQRQIRIGEEHGGLVPVLAGLTGGQAVVLGSAAMVRDGDVVRTVTAAKDKPA